MPVRSNHRWLSWSFACLLIGTAAGADDYRTDEHGRRFRIRFDPGSKIRLGLASGFSLEGESPGFSLEADLGLTYRSRVDFEDARERVSWFLDHEVLQGRIHPLAQGEGGVPALQARVYKGTFVRHASEPFVLLPTDPPRRLFFPFDIGVDVEVGSIGISPGAAAGDPIRLGLARALVVLDPWRPGRPGNGLLLGLGVRYELDVHRPGESGGAQVIHRVAPFTDTCLRFRYQDDPGLTVLDLRADLTPQWASRGGWGLILDAAVRFERVLLAVNDEPVSLAIESGYRWVSAVFHGVERGEFRAVAGLVVDFQLR